jgi:hypothetical protein
MSHAPKQLALEAYASALLSARATARVERHLAACTVCRAALAEVQAYAQLCEEARAETFAVPSWERLEAALDAPAKSAPPKSARRRQTGKLIALSWPLLALAAALAIAWLGKSDPEAAPRAKVAQQAHSPGSLPTPRMVVGFIGLLTGHATLVHNGVETPITLDSSVHEGDVLRTASDAQLHVQLAAGTGFALGSGTELAIARLRAGETELALAAGRVTSEVAKLAADARYHVLAGELHARVRGTRFWVERRAEVAVFVHEGQVEVARGNELLAQLTPGQGYPAARFSTPAASPAREPRVHFAPNELSHAVSLLLSAPPALRAFVVDGAAIPATSTLALRLPLGPTELTFEDQRGHIRTVQVDLNAPLTKLEPAALAELIAPKPGPVGYLSPEQISAVVRQAIDPLRRCYERNLRIEPKLAGKFALRIRVSAEGRVVRAELDVQAKLPIELERCIELEAQKLVFPKPEGGGPLSFEVPLNLKSTH